MNAMNPAWEPQWTRSERRRRFGRPPFGPMASAMDTPGPPVPPAPRGPGRGRRRGPWRARSARPPARRPVRPGFGPGSDPGRAHGGFPGPRGRRRGRRTPRGDIRSAVLALVAEQPRHGYEIIQEIGERTSGAWRPSPGSVYPTLSQLEDEGLVRVEQSEGRRVVYLTEAGSRTSRSTAPSWTRCGTAVGRDLDDEAAGLWEQLAQLHAAAQPGDVGAGTPEQIAAASAALAEARKTIYRLLAE